MMFATFKLLLDVQNVHADFDGRPSLVGFYVTRIITAPTIGEAFDRAKISLERSEAFKNLVMNSPNDPPIVTLDEYEVIDPNSKQDVETGFLFYDMPSH